MQLKTLIKTTLLIFIVHLCVGAATAQEEATAPNAADSATRATRYADPFYIQIYGGINKSGNENLPWIEMSSYPWSGGAFVGIGRELSPLWGWRAALRYNYNKSRNVQECENPDTYGWRNVGLFVDATFDLSDLARAAVSSASSLRYGKPALFNAKAFAGIGIARTWDYDQVPLSYTAPYSHASQTLPALRFGITATMQFAPRWRLGTELSHNLYEDHFNGVATDLPIDQRTNLKIGLTYIIIPALREAPKVVRLKKLRECPPLPLLIPPPEEVKIRQIEGRAFLDFIVDQINIEPDYRNNAKELRRIQATVDSALFDPNNVITYISLHGYASPESPYSHNTYLANGRTQSLMNYLISRYGFDRNLFDNSYTPEDWGNLRGFLTNMGSRRTKNDFWYDEQKYVETPEAPEIVQRYREELMRVIDLDMEPDAKEQVLKQVGGGEPYRWLHRYVYPGLRHTDYIIRYEVRQYLVEECKKLIYTHPEALSLKEMYMVAQSYPEGSDLWTDALLIAARQFPDDETANLNAACASLKTKRLNDARRYLQRAGNSAEAQYVNNVILAMEGQIGWHIEGDKIIFSHEK